MTRLLAATLLFLLSNACAAAEVAPRQNIPALHWIDDTGLTPAAVDLLNAMRDAGEWGLNPDDYAAAKILSDSRAATSPRQRQELDAALSAAARRFILHLHYGRIDPKTVGFDMPPRPQPFDSDAVLAELAVTRQTRGVLASIEPPFQHYAFLKTQLASYRRLAAQPQLTRLAPLHAKSITAGEFYSDTARLRALLVALGDMTPAERATDTDTSLDPQLVSALQRFQFRHGLKQDGVLGGRTYRALTTPITVRLRQIELTLERWRWLPALNSPTIIVNIPQFRLFAFSSASDRESQMLTMNVIVGQDYPHTRTPVFSADMKFVVFRPYWDVPYGIMSREILPLIRRDASYLIKQDLEIVTAEGVATQNVTPEQLAALATGRSRLRQRPGPQNSLGLIKFMLPNRYNVYLHATPAHALFKETRRAFSHGCIRVSDPTALAEYALRQAREEWPRERIETAMQGTETLRVDLERAVHVLIVYGTAVATENGRIYFFDDLYGNDARLAKILGLK